MIIPRKSHVVGGEHRSRLSSCLPKEKFKNDSGFTLIELIIVVVVIAILGSIGLSFYSGTQNQAHDSAVQQDLHQFKIARDINVAQG